MHSQSGITDWKRVKLPATRAAILNAGVPEEIADTVQSENGQSSLESIRKTILDSSDPNWNSLWQLLLDAKQLEIVQFQDRWYFGCHGDTTENGRHWHIYLPIKSADHLSDTVSHLQFRALQGVRENVNLTNGIEHAGFFSTTLRNAKSVARISQADADVPNDASVLFEAYNGDMFLVTPEGTSFWFVLSTQELKYAGNSRTSVPCLFATLKSFGTIDFWNMERQNALERIPPTK